MSAEHERHVDVKMGSERSFGIVFAAAFSIIGLWPLTAHEPPRMWALIVAVVFLALGLLAPKVLMPLNKLWFKLGMLLGAVVSPIIMALVFFVAVTPTALVMRALGNDLLREKGLRKAESYWIKRDQPVGSMKNQF